MLDNEYRSDGVAWLSSARLEDWSSGLDNCGIQIAECGLPWCDLKSAVAAISIP